MIGSKQTDSCQDIYEFVVKVLTILFVRHNVTEDKEIYRVSRPKETSRSR